MAILFRDDGKEVKADPSQIDILLKAGYSRTKPEPKEEPVKKDDDKKVDDKKDDGKKAEDKQPAKPENKFPAKPGVK